MAKLEETLHGLRLGWRIKRSKWKHWFQKNSNSLTISTEDLLADDWEAEAIKKEISRDDLANAMGRIQFEKGLITSSVLLDYLCKELGLE